MSESPHEPGDVPDAGPSAASETVAQREPSLPEPDRPDGRPRDPLLLTLHDASEQGIELGITLYIRGLVISGSMCRAAEFADHIGSAFYGADEGTIGKMIADELVETKAQYEERLERAYDPSEYNYLHLRNARMFTPGATPLPRAGTFMRFKIDEVDGWSFGSLEAVADSKQ